MRKIAFLFIAGLLVTHPFAQPRDLFAEFEAEAAEQSSAAVASSSSVAVQAAEPVKPAEAPKNAPAPVSSAAVSSAAVSSSSVAESSVSAEVSSSSVVVSSSSVAGSVSSSSATDSVAVVATMDSARTDSTVAVSDSAAVDSAMADSASQMTPEESYAATMDSLSNQANARDSLTAIASSSSVVAEAPSSSSINRRDLLGPVKVSKVNGIDEMKGRYKSPRKALFMSLVVPGSGQLYVGGSNFTYVRGAVYLALEAALWSGWYYYSVYKYDKQVNRYKKFAKTHYSIGEYENEMRYLYNSVSENEYEFKNRYLGTRESFCEGIFGNATMHGCYDNTKLYHNDTEYMNDFVKSPVNLGKEMDNVKFDSPSEVYQLIADDAYVLGWDDVNNPVPASSLELEDPNSATVVLGESEHQKEYRSLRSKANDYADMQAWFFGGLILNHIVSAVDAAFTANAHNKLLYEEDLSWYDHLHFDSGFSFVNGFGVNVQAGWAF